MTNSSSFSESSFRKLKATWLLRLDNATMVSKMFPVPCVSRSWMLRVSVVRSALMLLKLVLMPQRFAGFVVGSDSSSAMAWTELSNSRRASSMRVLSGKREAKV